jgi:hypothetical protein
MPADMMVKHWLLNLTVESPVWLSQIFPLVDSEGLNVKPVPGCHAADYANGLIELFDSDMILFSSEVPGDEVQSRSGIRLILARFLKRASDDPELNQQGHLRPVHERNRLPDMQVSFKLTARGGEAWESIAESDWNNILTVSMDRDSGDLCSPNRDLLMAYMGWYQEIGQQRIPPETINWQTHADFEILYWKRLPLVYHTSFTLEPAEPRWSNREPKWFREWSISAMTWHKKPWDLPGWPSE